MRRVCLSVLLSGPVSGAGAGLPARGWPAAAGLRLPGLPEGSQLHTESPAAEGHLRNIQTGTMSQQRQQGGSMSRDGALKKLMLQLSR